MGILPLRFHKPTGQFYYWNPLQKRREYLGADCDQARQRYNRLADAEAAKAAQPTHVVPTPSHVLSVNELLAEYLRHRIKEGTDPRDVALLKSAIRFAVAAHGMEFAASFRAKALKSVRDVMLAGKVRRGTADQPLSRKYVNKMTRQLQAAWGWAASEELIPAETAASAAMLMSASGSTTMWFLAPPRACTRLPWWAPVS
jgi:hypothetical protein